MPQGIQILPWCLLGMNFVEHTSNSWGQQQWLQKATFLDQGPLQLRSEGADNLDGCSILGKWAEQELTSHHRFPEQCFLHFSQSSISCQFEDENIFYSGLSYILSSSLLNSSQNRKTIAICNIKANEASASGLLTCTVPTLRKHF